MLSVCHWPLQPGGLLKRHAGSGEQKLKSILILAEGSSMVSETWSPFVSLCLSVLLTPGLWRFKVEKCRECPEYICDGKSQMKESEMLHSYVTLSPSLTATDSCTMGA